MVAGWFLSWNILLKWMIWEYPYLRKSTYDMNIKTHLSNMYNVHAHACYTH